MRIISHTISRRKLALACADQITIWVALLGSAFLRLGIGEGVLYIYSHLLSLVLLSLFYAATFYVADLYNPSGNIRSNRTILAIALATVAPLLLSTVLFYAHLPLRLGRTILVLIGGVVFLGTISSRRIISRLGRRSARKTRILIIGTGQAGKTLLDDIDRNSWNSVDPLGALNNPTSATETSVESWRILGDGNEVGVLASDLAADGVVIASTYERLTREMKQTLVKCRLNGIRVIDRFSFYSEFFGRIPCDFLTPEWLLYRTERLTSSFQRKVKRLFDFAAALFGLVVCSPLLLLTAVAIRLDSGGPIFYRQKRVGKDGCVFTLCKFRSMHMDAEKDGRAVFSHKEDPRITRVGKFIRKTRLDELPQLVNVLKGEMSVIGPRPERPTFVEEYVRSVESRASEDYSEKIPNYSVRLLVKPGITGWAQVNCGYADSLDSSRKKLEYDLYYIVNQSLVLDLIILLKTIKVVLTGGGV
ncbi:sugar transferase [Candidatus Poribacteria bacterium]|nr:sugar transferase [Candidatus Poribacteria bacterium]